MMMINDYLMLVWNGWLIEMIMMMVDQLMNMLLIDQLYAMMVAEMTDAKFLDIQ
jgi:hypothetical protein